MIQSFYFILVLHIFFVSQAFAQSDIKAGKGDSTVYIRSFCDVYAGVNGYVPAAYNETGASDIINSEPVDHSIAPADILRPIKPLKYPFALKVEADFLSVVDLPIAGTLQDMAELEGNVVDLEIMEDGRVFYEEQDLSSYARQYCVDDAVESGALVKSDESQNETEKPPQNALIKKDSIKRPVVLHKSEQPLINKTETKNILRGNTNTPILNKKPKDTILRGERAQLSNNLEGGDPAQNARFIGSKSDINVLLNKLKSDKSADSSGKITDGARQVTDQSLPSKIVSGEKVAEGVIIQGQYP